MDIRSIFALSCFLMLSACLGMGEQSPAPVSNYGVSSGAGSAGVHTVMASDSLYTVSRNYNLPMRDIVLMNNLKAPFKLKAGMRLKLPPPQEYQVKSGDTVHSVSLVFGVNPTEIVRLNDLRAPYSLRNGQVLRLPTITRKTQTIIRPLSAPVVSVESEVLAPPHSSAVAVVEEKKDSKSSRKTVEAEIDSDSEKNPAWAFDPPAKEVVQSKGVETEVVEEISLPKKGGAVLAQNEDKSAKPLRMINNVPRREASRFLRPVQGEIIDDFGAKKDGQHNDGINIKASKGTSVLAAENGVVVYTGNAIKGMGNLILLRHQDQWITSYAHLDDVSVSKGDVIRRGQAIGTVGSTGSVSKPQLHFEVRRGVESINPENYLE